MGKLTLNEHGETRVSPAPSPFARTVDEFLAKGYSAICVMPRDKAPGEYQGTRENGRWTLAYGWNEYAKQKPSAASIDRWKTWPDANIGIVLGTPVGGYQLICIDFDTDDESELDQLQSQLPPSRMMKRGHRGFSAFYRAGKDVKTKRYMIADPAPGAPAKKRCVLELLTGNAPRQTVMPPSWHPNSGREYEWLTGDGIVPIAELPVLSDHHFEQLEDTLEHLGWGGDTAAPVHDRADRETARVTDDPNIWRETNDIALQKMDSWVRDLGLPKLKRHPNGSWEAVPTWRPSNEGRPTMQRKANLKFHRDGIRDMGGDKGYSPLDVVEHALSCSFDDAFSWLRQKLGLNDEGFDIVDRPRQLIQDEHGTLSDAVTGEVVEIRHANDNAEFPEDLTWPAGLLGDLVDWIEGSARRPNRVLSLASAIMVLGTLIGRRDAGPTRTGTHLYLLALARTGAGKQHGLDCAMRLLEAAGAGQHIASGDFMSQTALMNRIESEPLSLCLADEFGATMAKLNSLKAGDHVTGMKKLMRSAWGCSFGTIYSGEWAGRKAAKVSAPALSILGVSTPGEFFDAVQGGDIVNGALNRFLLLSTGTRSADRDPPLPPTVPPQIADRLIGMYQARRQGVGTLSELATVEPAVVPWGDEEARALYRSFVAECEARGDANGELEPYLARTGEMAVRLATICAVGRDPDYPSVSVEDMAWGRAVAMWSSAKMAKEAGDHVADTDTSRMWSKIIRKLENSPTGRVGKTEMQNCIGRTAKEMDGALRDLEGMGKITFEEIKPLRGPTRKMIALAAR